MVMGIAGFIRSSELPISPGEPKLVLHTNTALDPCINAELKHFEHTNSEESHVLH